MASASFARVCAAGDWDTVLALLLDHPGLKPHAERAHLRGQAWQALGVPAAAAEFFEDAKRARRAAMQRDAGARFAFPRVCGVETKAA